MPCSCETGSCPENQPEDVHRFSMATLGGFESMIFPTSPCTSLLIRSETAGDFSRLAGKPGNGAALHGFKTGSLETGQVRC